MSPEHPNSEAPHIKFAPEPQRGDNGKHALYIPGPRERENGRHIYSVFLFLILTHGQINLSHRCQMVSSHNVFHEVVKLTLNK